MIFDVASTGKTEPKSFSLVNRSKNEGFAGSLLWLTPKDGKAMGWDYECY